MTLEVLSSIKGAKPSEVINELFEVVKKAFPDGEETKFLNIFSDNVVTLNDLRNDDKIESTESEKKIIRDNFPLVKDGFLVVAKVIED